MFYHDYLTAMDLGAERHRDDVPSQGIVSSDAHCHCLIIKTMYVTIIINLD